MKANKGYVILEKVKEESASGLIITSEKSPKYQDQDGKVLYAQNVYPLDHKYFYCKEEDVIAYEL
jgi:co-chaperonin GroES (HSP10)